MIAFLLDTLLMTGALIALVLVLRRPVSRAFGPQVAYALWALPLLRFVMPPILLPASFAPRDAATQLETVAAAPVTDDVVIYLPQGDAVPAAEPVASATAGIPWFELALAVWLGGALVFLAWRCVSYRRMRRDLLADARPVGEVGKVRLVEAPAVTSPVAFGLLDKVVALPMFFMVLEDRGARDLAIAHELAHHRGRDLAANIVAQPLLALHWFNPLAWLGWRAMRRDQEAACDARVMAACGRVERTRYAEVIASFAAGPRLAMAAPMACPVLGEKSIIHRLRSLKMDDVSRRRRLLGRGLVIAGGLALPLTATVTYAQSDAPELPAVPDAAAPPDAPDAPTTRRTIIVDIEGGADPDDPSLHTRTVTANGRTVVLKTDRELTDEEARERVEQAFRRMPGGVAVFTPTPPVPPVPGVAPMPPAAPMPAMPSMTFSWSSDDPEFEAKMEQWGAKMEAWGEKLGEEYAKQAEAHAFAWSQDVERKVPVVVHSCAGNPQSVTRTETTDDGRQKIVICERVAQRQALRGLRSARETIARDRQIDPEVRDEVLQELDEEIERIESDG